ncbi:MAG: FHA domain-containing protein [Deltaproteobacteria bacterium]|nr:FHA domain-containing protein [Deltaproteobacteria bacterium]
MLLRISIAKAGQEVCRCPEFDKPELTIGRRPTNDIILPNDGVSGSHARLLVTGRTLTLIDLGSTNGTFIGGERIEGPRPVAAGDRVLIGEYQLGFELVDGAAAHGSGPTVTTTTPVPRLPLSAALGWTADAALPPPPPLLDDCVPAETLPGPPPERARAAPAPLALTPVGPALTGPATEEAVVFAFDPQGPTPLVEQVFSAVWRRVADDVIANAPGIRPRVRALLERALAAASQVGTMPEGIGETMTQEMLSPTVVASLLIGDPDEVLVQGTGDLRVDRGGHITTGPGPLSCASAVTAVGARLCGVSIGPERPVARRHYGEYVVHAIDPSCAGGVATLVLRRGHRRLLASLEDLAEAGCVALPDAAILRAAVRAGLTIVVCAAPGAPARSVVAALMGAAPSSELQVVIARAGSDARALRPGTVVLTREPACPRVVDAALRLAPSRLGLEDIPWDDTEAMDALTSASIRTITSVRAANPGIGLTRLSSMLEARRGGGVSSRQFIAGAVDLFVTVTASRDGSPCITRITETLCPATGEPELRDIGRFDPDGRAWVGPAESSPCLDDLIHRGLLDPHLLAPAPAMESCG